MQVRNIISEDDAVSPVIGVILMVAITVILAAVIGTFVLGLGDQVQSTAPQASFTFDFTDDGTGSPETGDDLMIVHDGGDPVPNSELRVVSDSTTYESGVSGVSLTGQTDATWKAIAGASNADVSAGSQITITDDDTTSSNNFNSATIRLTWQRPDGGSTATLGKWSGPSA